MVLPTAAEMRQAQRQLEGRENTHRDALVRFASNLGYLSYNTHNSKHSPPGHPDLHVVSQPPIPAPLILYAELKRPYNHEPSGPQRAWLDALGAIARRVNAAAGFELMIVTLLIVPDQVQAMCDLLAYRRRATVEQLRADAAPTTGSAGRVP